MPIPYPMQTFGRFKLGLALTYQLVHDRFGFDFGERYHRDVDYRIQTTMAIDRAVFEAYGRIGLGHARPFPRVSVEPFGHRFMPAMYGAETGYASDADPWVKPRAVTAEEILSLEPWTIERLQRSEPVRCVLDQFEYLHALDVGQDTDFEQLATAFPHAEVNCILFPGWIASHAMDDVELELSRLMVLGRRFPAFSFTLLEVDSQLGSDVLFEFHETFRRCALAASAPA